MSEEKWKANGNESSLSSASTATSTRVQMQIHNRKRKRRHTSAPSSILSGSSSSSSEEDDDELNIVLSAKSNSMTDSRNQDHTPKRQMQQPEGWRVKLYRLNTDGSWDDCGTGRIVCLYKTSSSGSSTSPQEQLHQELGEPTLCMQAEASSPRVLLRTKILLRDAYQRQGDNIITWCEPYFEDSSTGQQEAQAQGVDLALSFQDNAGCLDIWRQITQVQSRAAEWFRSRGIVSKANQSSSTMSPPEPAPSVTDMAQAVAAAHHANLQRQQQHAMWVNVASEATQRHFQESMEDDEDPNEFREQDAEAVAVSMAAAAAAAAYGGASAATELPQIPALQNLEEIADSIAAAQPLPQRECLAIFISKSDCSYFKALLQLFDSAEARQDYGALATLAVCVKTILLLNDPTIIDWIVNSEKVYEQVCSSLEYDPDLRDKANHRWFLKERAKFRTVVLMEDEDLINTIHRSFRVNYLRDTLLRPTMDESSLSTLSSLQTFTHADVVKGVTSPLKKSTMKDDSYLIRVMRMLGMEVRNIGELEWEDLEKDEISLSRPESPQPAVVASDVHRSGWKQHLAPQDDSLSSRKIRRRGCLSFFRELFSMVRMSLQQSDKDDFYAAIVCMEVDLQSNEQKGDFVEPTSDSCKLKSEKSLKQTETVNLLSLLASILSDPTADVSEKGCVLEIASSIAMHDPSHIRRHALEYHDVIKKNPDHSIEVTDGRPTPNDRRQLFFKCPPNDFIAALLFLLAAETDAGLLLQTTEIMRIILDTDMMGDHGPMGGGMIEDNDLPPPGMELVPNNENENANITNGRSSNTQESDQNQFLSLFYDHFVQWLVAPFQYTILCPAKRLPESAAVSRLKSSLLDKIMHTFKRGVTNEDSLLRIVPQCAIRGSFAVELLSFCVRAHLYRMKFFLLKYRVLGNVMKLLYPGTSNPSGDRCLKLAALRLLRSILSVKDEFYNRHIIQHNLFAPVFEIFRANPIGDNLLSSAIVEMCDFIQTQNIKSLIEYIVTKHLTSEGEPDVKSLEDVATPYVSTLTTMRKAYEENFNAGNSVHNVNLGKDGLQIGKGTKNGVNDNTRFLASALARTGRARMNEKALEDQRKFREVDAEESYFEADEDEPSDSNVALRTLSPTLISRSPVEKSDVPSTTQSISDSKNHILHKAKDPI
eukprot:CAMPEP_0194202828 /NCGR_PEP_ID=MMETSP0156-20130528/2753_1 /TAXON_ID=33649 /ORGANISM="Thalassionema nitzschioides, Strain L26-B" /LENGTH=1160 /DNA_ID=CAMNT_0038928433 /DNA_START=97 /DNA_END=3579 /DNA_ORIENTATION=+